MMKLLEDEGAEEVEVIRARGTAAGYRVKYRLTLKGGRGSKRMEEIVKNAPWVRRA